MMRETLSRISTVILVLGLTVSLGCHGDTTGPTLLSPAHLYWQLSLTHHAITMALTAPYNTLQLQAIPLAVTGDALSDSEPTIYTSSDSTKVAVSATGLLTALKVGNDIMIAATHQHDGKTLTDTASVNVNDVAPVPVFTTMTLTPVGGDSAVLVALDALLQNGKVLQQQTLDQTGTPIDNVVVRYSSKDSTIASFSDDNSSTVVGAGSFGTTTTLYSEATIYGIRRTDSLRIVAGYPTEASVQVLPKVARGSVTQTGYFSPETLTVNMGAMVAWYSNLAHGQAIDVVFDNPAVVAREDSVDFANNVLVKYLWYGLNKNAVIPSEAGGNIVPFTKDSVCIGGSFGNTTNGVPCSDGIFYYLGHARRFLAVGDYPYHSTAYGTAGVIRVVPNP